MVPVIKTENLTHIYSPGTPFEMTAIEDINLEVYPGEFVGIIGQTGSGKSTLIQHLNGLVKPSSGTVLVDGEDIHSSKAKTHKVRFKVGLVFQYPEYQLFEETIYKDIAFGPKNLGLSKEEVDARVREAAKITGIPEEVFDKSPFDLSGGQKRRVAIAGVMAMKPEVLILDEPIAGLDPKGRQDIIANIREYHRKTGAAVIMVTHSMEDAAENTEKMFVLNQGRLVMQGTPKEVFSHSEELISMGLDVPPAAKVAVKLRSLGVPVSEDVYTKDALLKELTSLKGGAENA